MYKQFLGFFKLNKLMKIVFSELSKKCRIPCKQPIKCQEIKNKIHQTTPFLGGGSYFDTTYWIITEEPIIPLCKLTNGWHYNSPGLGAHWSVVVMENLVNNTGSGFSGWAVDADKRRTVLEKKHKTRSCFNILKYIQVTNKKELGQKGQNLNQIKSPNAPPPIKRQTKHS